MKQVPPKTTVNVVKAALLIGAKGLGNGKRLMELLQEREGDAEGLLKDILADKVKKAVLTPEKLKETERTIEEFLADGLNSIIPFESEDYPPLLKEIPSGAPYLLFVRGASSFASLSCAAIVGTREPTEKKRKFAFELAYELASRGYAIVSGGAFGIDSAAHEGALAAGGATYAVMGTGHRFAYPAANRKLFENIAQKGGATISELLPSQPGAPSTFGARNRIIAAMASATIVVEGGESSGALITAREASKYQRPVLAVPGDPDDPLARGTNLLLSAGAKPCLGVNSALEALSGQAGATKLEIAPRQRKQKPLFPPTDAQTLSKAHKTEPLAPPNFEKLTLGMDEDEKNVFFSLVEKPVQVDDIIEKTGLPSARVNAILTLLELKGLAKKLSGMIYVYPRS